MGVVSTLYRPAAKREDPAAISRKTANMSGITCSAAQGKLITLSQLRDNLNLSITEARKAQKDERVGGRLLAAAKAAQATCNVILDVVGAFNETVGVIGSLSKFGQSVAAGDTYGATTAAIDAAVGTRKLSTPQGAAREALERAEVGKDTIKKRTDMWNSGIKGELNTSKVSQYAADSVLEVGELSAGQMKADKISKIIKAARGVNQYVFDMAAIVSELNESEDATKQDSGAIKGALNQLERIEKKIAEIQELGASCESPQLQLLLL